MHAIIKALKSLATKDRKAANESFFKTGKGEYAQHDEFIGIRASQIRQIAKKYFKSLTFNEIDKLINHPIHEVRHCGLIILVSQYQAGNKSAIFNYYINNIHAVNNWDLVDTTTPQIIGDYLYQHQDKLSLLFDFAQSSNLWKKRIAIVATWSFIKNGEFAPTLKITKLLLRDEHDLIHKAIGWMLREIYKKNTDVCKIFLRNNYTQLPRTTLRYAIERMHKNERLLYLKGEFSLKYQINFYVPIKYAQVVKNAMFDAGAGKFDNYEHCAWQTLGTGQFKPIGDARPIIGELNKLKVLEEYKVEMLCTKDKIKQVISVMKLTHPYEQVAYSIFKME